jgi:hypothetical protein
VFIDFVVELYEQDPSSRFLIESFVKPFILEVTADLAQWMRGEIHATCNEFQPRIVRARHLIGLCPELRNNPDQLMTTQLKLIDRYEAIADVMFFHPS